MTISDDSYKGYRNIGLEVLKKNKVQVWSDVVVYSTRGIFKGIILPRSETADDKHIVLKMITGYNIGINAHTIERIEEKGYRKANY